MTTIAYVLKMYPRFSETFIVNEILELERQGLEVRIYALMKPNDGRFHASLARVKASVVYVPEHPLSQMDEVWPAHRALFEADRGRYLAVLRHALSRGHQYAIKRFVQAGVIAAHMRRHPVTAMHAHFASSAARAANFVNRLIGVPYSFTAHAKDIFHEEVEPESLRGKIRGARFVVTVSDFNREYLQQLMPATGAPATGDIRRLYNGVDLTLFRPDPAVVREPGLILSVGRLVEKKGFEVLIEACALLAQRGLPFRCEIIGKGSLEAALNAQIDARGLRERVQLVGPRPQEQVLEAYRRAAVFALPCIIGTDGNRDGLPTVLLEAMAAGLPVVSTDVTGVPEIIDDGETGRVVAQNDPAALAAALADLLADPAQGVRLAQAARLKAEREFDVRQNVGTLRQWLVEEAAPAAAPYAAGRVTQTAVTA